MTSLLWFFDLASDLHLTFHSLRIIHYYFIHLLYGLLWLHSA